MHALPWAPEKVGKNGPCGKERRCQSTITEPMYVVVFQISIPNACAPAQRISEMFMIASRDWTLILQLFNLMGFVACANAQ